MQECRLHCADLPADADLTAAADGAVLSDDGGMKRSAAAAGNLLVKAKWMKSLPVFNLAADSHNASLCVSHQPASR